MLCISRLFIVSVIGFMPGAVFGQADIVVADFEADSYKGWKVEGSAFGNGPVDGALPEQHSVTGFEGKRTVNSFHGGDSSTGTLTSDDFEIQRSHITFLIGGGSNQAEVGIELLVANQAVRAAAGENSEELKLHTWDVSQFRGKRARLRIFDKATGGWGHINVDHILQTDFAPQPAVRISDYRKSRSYLNERFRPQFHFSPEMNWMNDPNGLVYFDGEYHLFFQFNPHGNQWGHMSWGHAVSEDLVHWKHLPIALHDELGVMVFSGCCVVDHKNSSGFGDGKTPPMVAIYTGHGYGRQTQDIAYSNDRGRTWTKYEGNPVLDKNEADFRDPKVFWHDESGQWVMVVSMAIKKVIQFYGSDDLKDWKLLSEFGPAGVKEKPNWECPDLFELPVEGEPDTKRWVLEVDMGGGSVAGGSGGEYFVGEFNGKSFVCEHGPKDSRWVDYGADFYAPVSWSNIPKADGRRIWIGWMNNWSYANNIPTSPWRSSMSIPRALSLRKKQGQHILVQRPVEELKSLRGSKIEVPAGDLADVKSIGLGKSSCNQFELIAEFDVGAATELGFRVLKSGDQETVIGYDTRKQTLFIDRTVGGKSDFSNGFARRHEAPLKSDNGIIKVHIFVDRSSVEVFASDGEIVMTDRVFPTAVSDEIEVFAIGGAAKIQSLNLWPLKSIW